MFCVNNISFHNCRLVKVFQELLMNRVISTDISDDRFYHEPIAADGTSISQGFVLDATNLQLLQNRLALHLDTDNDYTGLLRGDDVDRYSPACSRCNSVDGDADDCRDDMYDPVYISGDDWSGLQRCVTPPHSPSR